MAVVDPRLNVWKSRSSHLVLAWAAMAAPVAAQSVPTPAPPIRSVIDENGVDLSRGTFTVTTPGVSIGEGKGALSFSQTWIGSGWRDTLSATISGNLAHPVVSIGGISESYTATSSTTYVADQGNGSSLSYNSSTGYWNYVGRDGMRISFTAAVIDRLASNLGTASIIVTPDQNQTVYRMQEANYKWRIISVSNDYGYQIRFTYANNNPQFPVEYNTITKATASNGIIDYCDTTSPAPCSYSRAWPTVSFALTGDYNSGSQIVTDAIGNETRYTFGGGKMVAIKRPGSSTDTMTIGYDASGKVNGVSTAASNWIYSYTDSGATRTTTRQNVAGNSIVAVSDPFNGLLKSYRDENLHTTSYQHDPLGRITRITAEEGNYVEYGLDARGNVTSTSFFDKSNDPLTKIVLTATYNNCVTIFVCNKPDTTTDAKGKVTNYTYDSTNGDLLTVAAPAVSGGRPTTSYSYTKLRAYFKRFPDGNFSSAQAISMLTGVTICRTATTCPGNAFENKATFTYGVPNTPNNLLLTAEARGSGDGLLIATTSYGYDPIGNRLTIDGPRPGGADVTARRYNLNRQLVGVIGPDPDGGGALKNRALRYTYDPDGQVTLAELGTTPGQTDSDWAQFDSLQQVATAYDSAMRPYRTAMVANGGTYYTLTEYSYDPLGRPDCVAVRMNQATFGAVTPACTQVTPQGSFGKDRILKYGYDAAGQVLTVTTGVGTSLSRTEATQSYTPNGQVQTLADAKGNLTTYAYDRFDRLKTIYYPNKTGGGSASNCAVSTTDCQEFTYDVNGNIVNIRVRNGSSFAQGFDDLNRLTSRTLPAGTGNPSPTFAYDLVGNLREANNGYAPAGYSNGVVMTWDALGRKLTETSTYNGTGTITKTMEYDLAGNQTKFAWPDLHVTYDYDNVNEMTAIRENGGSLVLASFTYDDLGRRTNLTRGNLTQTNYTYDAVSRLQTLGLGGGGSGTLITLGSYNPANEIGSRTNSSDAYAWTGGTNANNNYTRNGLNQYTQIGSAAPGYDTKANLTSLDGITYTFGIENTLTTGAGSSYWHDALQRITYLTSASQRQDYNGDRLVGIYDSSNNLLRRYVYGPGVDEPIVWYEGSGATDRRYMDADERGSIIRVTSQGGGLLRINTYDEFGRPGTNNLGRFQYTGQVWIGDLKVYNYKNRLYAPSIGRFMQPDPIGYDGGLNLYNYVGSNPTNFVDPLGLAPNTNNAPDCLSYYCPIVNGQLNLPGSPSRSEGGAGGAPIFNLFGASSFNMQGRGALASFVANAPINRPHYRYVNLNETAQPKPQSSCPQVPASRPVGMVGQWGAALLDPFNAFKARDLATKAQNASMARFPNLVGGDDIKDAYRHFYWVASMTRSGMGARSALAFANAHEVEYFGDTSARNMDTFNNWTAALMAGDAKWSGTSVAKLAETAIQNNCLAVLK